MLTQLLTVTTTHKFPSLADGAGVMTEDVGGAKLVGGAGEAGAPGAGVQQALGVVKTGARQVNLPQYVFNESCKKEKNCFK